jgi:hypothetical protein
MTEVAETKKSKRYVRLTRILELYNSGITELNELAKALSESEASLVLRRGIKSIRDEAFYVKVVHWNLKMASKKGLVVWTEVKKPRKKRVVEAPVLVVNEQPVETTVNTAQASTESSDSIIPTL